RPTAPTHFPYTTLFRSDRNHRPPDREEVVQIDSAQHLVQVVAEGEIGRDGKVRGHLPLHADAQMLRLRRHEVADKEVRARSEDGDDAHWQVRVVRIHVQL